MTLYFATVARGLEALAAQELERLGAQQVSPEFCGVAFAGDLALLYRVNLWARIPFRILLTLNRFACHDARDLYAGIQDIPWQDYLTPAQTLAVTATGKNAQLNHTHFSALQVKNAIVDQQQAIFGERSSIDTQTPDIRINIHIERDHCVVSLDSSGESLHRRGYRPAMGAAPLKESLAAALIQLTQWQGTLPFLDPMCGSGTLVIEAGLSALNVAPGLFREQFGFERWSDFDAELWQQCLQQAEADQKQVLSVPIIGSDNDDTVIQQAEQNAYRSGVLEHIQLQTRALEDLEAPASEGILLCNPPYGERIGRDQDLGALYKLLGDVLKQRFKGWTAYILSGNKALAQSIGLKSAQRLPIWNGSIACQLMKYELY
jgi:putative N6-adenine-specific DNA methylase